MNYTFDSKETYLAARSTWKNDYESKSQEIRDAKVTFKLKQREFSATEENSKDFWAAWSEVERARVSLGARRYEARNLLDELSSMKVEAERQWQASHQKVSTVA